MKCRTILFLALLAFTTTAAFASEEEQQELQYDEAEEEDFESLRGDEEESGEEELEEFQERAEENEEEEKENNRNHNAHSAGIVTEKSEDSEVNEEPEQFDERAEDNEEEEKENDRNHNAHSAGIIIHTRHTDRFCLGASTHNKRTKFQRDCKVKVARRHAKSRVSKWCIVEEEKRCVHQKSGFLNKQYTVVARNLNRLKKLPFGGQFSVSRFNSCIRSRNRYTYHYARYHKNCQGKTCVNTASVLNTLSRATIFDYCLNIEFQRGCGQHIVNRLVKKACAGKSRAMGFSDIIPSKKAGE